MDEYSEMLKLILVILVIYLMLIMSIPYFFPTDNKIVLLLRAYHIPLDGSYIDIKDPQDDIQRSLRHLKIRFVYTCPKKCFINIKKLNEHAEIEHLFYFKRNSEIYECFFVVKDCLVKVPQHYRHHIKTYPYKMYDTYVMGDTRIFNSIQDILMCQGFDRDAYGENCISTVYLNEICSNKIEYIKYLSKHGLMIETVIKPYKQGKGQNEYPGRYVKAPYSSRSVCAFYEKVDAKCFLEDGVIVQEKNHLLDKYEFKCYVIDGKIQMTVVRLAGKNINICVPEDDQDYSEQEFPSIPDNIKQMVKKYKKEMEIVCKKTFYCMNSLIHMRIQKLEKDEEAIGDVMDVISGASLSIHDKKVIRYVLNGLVNSEKIKILNTIDKKYNKKIGQPLIDVLTKPINNYVDMLDTNNNSEHTDITIPKNFKIYDRFMRVDMALPDGKKYNKITVTEIEPFASGIYMYKTIGPCMRNDDYNKFDNITMYNLYKIISTENKSVSINNSDI